MEGWIERGESVDPRSWVPDQAHACTGRPSPHQAGCVLGTHLLQLSLLLVHVAELGGGTQEARRVDDDHVGAEAVLHADHDLARVEAPQLVVLQALVLPFDVLLSGGWIERCGKGKVSVSDSFLLTPNCTPTKLSSIPTPPRRLPNL